MCLMQSSLGWTAKYWSFMRAGSPDWRIGAPQGIAGAPKYGPTHPIMPLRQKSQTDDVWLILGYQPLGSRHTR